MRRAQVRTKVEAGMTDLQDKDFQLGGEAWGCVSPRALGRTGPMLEVGFLACGTVSQDFCAAEAHSVWFFVWQP